MVIRFFWTRAATVWLGVLYMVLGLLLLLFPDASGRLFVRSLAAGAVVYGVVHLWRYGQDRRTEEASPGDLFLGVLPLAFAVFALLRPLTILAFLPLTLGLLLLADGIGKIPLMARAVKGRGSDLIPQLIACLLPIALGILLVANPFRGVRAVIVVFGVGLLIDGASDLATALLARRAEGGG